MFANGYSYRRKITVDNTKVAGSSDLTDFPVLFVGTYAYLATVANGGKVTDSSGNDIRFETLAGSKLDHELVSYTAASGAVQVWLRIPTLGGAVDTEIYMYYGKSGASTEQNPTGVWSSAYRAVWHLEETSSSFNDSTSNNVDSTSVTATARGSAAKVGTGVDLSGASDVIGYGDVLDMGTTDMVISMWIKTSQAPSDYSFILSKSFLGSQNYRYAVGMYAATAKARIFLQGNGGADIELSGSTTVNNNVWHLIHYAFDRDGVATIYVDGVADGTVSISTWNGLDFQSANPFLIGTYAATNTLQYDGLLDEIRVRNALLAPDWIATEYNNQNDPSTFYSLGSEDSGSVPHNSANFNRSIEVGNGMSRNDWAS